jgi:DeoR family transcriptional regulator, deoxyribose operon repressor
MPTRKRRDRLSQILGLLDQTHGSSIRELSRRLGVSEMTVRRDLDLLTSDNKATLVRAGAIPMVSARYSLADESTGWAGEKMRIGRKAASLIERDDVVIIDSGSTTEWMARSIPLELPVTILCFALNILLGAGRGKERSVVLAGGAMREDTLVFASPEGVSLVRRYRAHKAFLSAEGVDAALGVTCTDPAEAELKKAAIASAQSRILLADSRKLGRVRPAWFADMKDFDAIITDTGIALEYVEIIRAQGIALHVV